MIAPQVEPIFELSDDGFDWKPQVIPMSPTKDNMINGDKALLVPH